MAKEQKTTEGTVVRSFLHDGEDQPAGTDLELDTPIAKYLAGTGQFAIDPDARKRARANAEARAKAAAGDTPSKGKGDKV